MKKIGIIDVGSNSMRLVIYKVSPNNAFVPIEDVKEGARLGEDVNITGKIKESKLELGFRTMMLFKGICDSHQVDEIIAFGTAAIRSASNSGELLDAVRNELGIDIKIFSGSDEATHSFLGAINSLDIKDGIMMDMGGASTELVWFKERKAHKWVSLNFGSVTIGQMADIKNKLKDKDEKRIRKHIKDELEKVEWLNETKGLTLVGVGGVVRNVASIHHRMVKYPLNTLHGYRMELEDVRDVFNMVKEKDYEEKLDIEGLSRSRADIFMGAVVAIEEILEYAELQHTVISGNGIREGVLFERLKKMGREIKNVFENSLTSLIEQYEVHREERRKVYGNFKKIFRKLAVIHEIEEISEKSIKAASTLGRTGVYINFYNHELHSAYVILNSGIKGMEHQEIVTAALMLIDHDEDSELAEKFYPLLSKMQVQNLPALSKILSLSEAFNKILVGEDDFEIEIGEKKIVFCIKKEDLLDIQIAEMFISKRRFKEIFGRGIEIKRYRRES